MKQNCDALVSSRKEIADYTSKLYSAFKAGDMTAFSLLYDLHINMLFNYGCRLTTDRELLKDCIHDIFVKIYSKSQELGDIDNFKSYLLISLKNRLCDEVRKRMNLSDTAIEEVDPASSDDVEDCYISKEKELNNNQLLMNLLSQLSPRQREALTLYYLEEKKYEDICRIMNMNYQSIRNLMHRGLSKLRTLAN